MASRAPGASVDVGADEFNALFEQLRTWGRWGPDDERGALNLITAERVAAAVGLVREGITMTLSLPLNTHLAEHCPNPADHHMTALGAAPADADETHFNKDYVGADYHNDGHTHIDALSHVAYDGSLYNGKPEAAVNERGAGIDSVEVLKGGLVGRGVLLDVPRARGVSWLEPGEHIFRDDLEAAEDAQGVRVGQGDILLVRTGHVRRLNDVGSWDTPNAKAGLHPTALSFIADRDIAVLGSDGNSDTAPSTTEGVAFPIHVLTITAMGIHLLDYLQFEDVREVCERTGRWDFLFVGTPLRIVHGTGSPLNPIAIF
ncbi:MAG: cyclase family protein [Solirubrobacteraceae bacterium]